jgi:hypothetical protein
VSADGATGEVVAPCVLRPRGRVRRRRPARVATRFVLLALRVELCCGAAALPTLTSTGRVW